MAIPDGLHSRNGGADRGYDTSGPRHDVGAAPGLAQRMTCFVCGFELATLHCKVVCLNCGAAQD